MSFSQTLLDSLREFSTDGISFVKVAKKLQRQEAEGRSFRSSLSSFYETRQAGYKLGAANTIVTQHKILADPEAPASILLIALKNVLGENVYAWEPESIWVELEDKQKLDIPLENRDKIQAAITLVEVPAFYWEVNTFQNTVMAFNDYPSNPEVIQEATPAFIAWATYEAELIRTGHDLAVLPFDYEPRLYTAEVMHRAGLVLAPKQLAFAQEELNTRNRNGAGPRVEQIRQAWDQKVHGGSRGLDLANHVFAETETGTQLAKLAACQYYVSERIQNYDKYLTTLL